MGALFGVGVLLMLLQGRKPLTTTSFNLTGPRSLVPWAYSYTEYRDFALDEDAPREELEAHSTDPIGVWRTVSPGRIPTPTGGSIPIPVPWPGGKVNVNEMLKDVEEEAPATEQDPGGPISVNFNLQPIG